MESSVGSVMARSCPVAKSTVHRTLDTPSIVVERLRPAAYLTTPVKAPIVVLALISDPITLVSPPRLGKRTPFPAACHATLQVVPRVHGPALPAAPQVSWKMLLKRLWLCCLLIRLALLSLRCLPHPSSLAHQLVLLLGVR